MTELVKETIITEGTDATRKVESVTNRDATSYQTVEYLVYFLFGVLEVLLIFRFILKFLGASYSSAFIGIIYTITNILVMPFEGIFSKWFTKGVETTSVLEPATIVAVIVYAVIGFGIVKLIRILSGKQQSTT